MPTPSAAILASRRLSGVLLRKSALSIPRRLLRTSRCYSDIVQSATERVALNPTYFVHVGNCIMLAGLVQSDMLNLRCMLVAASTCGIAFNLLQPKPLVAPAIWGVAFLTIHFYMIGVLLRERRELELTDDQEMVYTQAFLPYGCTRQQFLDILKGAEPLWHDFSSGMFIRRRGEEMEALHYIFEGEATLLSGTDDVVGKIDPGRGSWLGEFFDPNQKKDYWEKPHPSPVSFKCTSERCRTMALPRRALHDTLSGNQRLKEAAIRAQVSDVWKKLHGTMRDMRRDTYNMMLGVSLSSGTLDLGEKKMLSDFKERHKISDDEHHAWLVAHGWSADEFRNGQKGDRRRSGVEIRGVSL